MHPSTSYLLLVLGFVFLSTSSLAQKKEIKGQVVFFNSKAEHGKIIFADKVKISSPISGAAYSDKKGRFKLDLKGTYDGQPIFFQVDKKSYQVVDHKSLQYTLIDKKSRLRIELAKKGYIKNLRGVIEGNAKKALYAKENELLDLIAFGGTTKNNVLKDVEKRFGRELLNAFDTEELIDEVTGKIEELARFTSYELAIVNPDFASEYWMSAMESYNRSDLDATIQKLQEENIDLLSEEILSKIEKVKDRPKKVDWIILSKLRDLKTIKDNYTFQIIALQQSLRLTEADVVLKKLAKINAAAPTYKHSKILEKLNFFPIINTYQEVENIVLQKENVMETIPEQNTIDSRTRSSRSFGDIEKEVANVNITKRKEKAIQTTSGQNTIDTKTKSSRSFDNVEKEVADLEIQNLKEEFQKIKERTEQVRNKNKNISDEISLEYQPEVIAREKIIPIKENQKEITAPVKVVRNTQGSQAQAATEINHGNIRTKIVITISTSNEIIEEEISTPSTPTESTPQAYEVVENISPIQLDNTQNNLVTKGENSQQQSTAGKTEINNSDFENILFQSKNAKKSFNSFLNKKTPATSEEKLQ